MRDNILFVHPGILFPIQGGGPARTWSLIDFLRNNGYTISLVTGNHGTDNEHIAARVDFLYTPNVSGVYANADTTEMSTPTVIERCRAWCEDTARNLFNKANSSGMLQMSAIQRNRRKSLEILAGEVACKHFPVAAIATYVWLARALDLMPPGTLRILDTIDVQHIRYGLARKSGGNLNHLRCTREEEERELRRSDIILAIQEEEERLLRDMCPEKQILCVRYATACAPFFPSSGLNCAILYVGNKYDPNIKGLKTFLESTWPLVLNSYPEAELIVCGRICEVFKPVYPNVVFSGVVPNLDPYYERAHLVINPVAYGTGIKIKSVEALAHGRCLVCTPEGTQGLGNPGELPLVVVEQGTEMAAAIVNLLVHPEERHRIEEQAILYAKCHFSAEAVYNGLAKALIQNRKESL